MERRWTVLASCVVAMGCTKQVLPSEVNVDGYRIEMDAAPGPWHEGETG